MKNYKVAKTIKIGSVLDFAYSIFLSSYVELNDKKILDDIKQCILGLPTDGYYYEYSSNGISARIIEGTGTNISIKCVFNNNRSLDFDKKIIDNLYLYFKDMTIEELNALFIDKIVVTDQFIIKNEKSISFISEYDTLLKVDGILVYSDKEKPFMIRLVKSLEFISNEQSVNTDEPLVFINNRPINIKFTSKVTIAENRYHLISDAKYFKYTVEADLSRLNELKDIVYDYYNYKEEEK